MKKKLIIPGMGSHVVSLAPMASVPYLASSTTSSSNLDYECIDIHDRECFLLACKNHWMLQNKFHHTMINGCSSISPVMIYPEELGRQSQINDIGNTVTKSFVNIRADCTNYLSIIDCNY